MSELERLIFHIDVNSAFLSWSAMDRVRQGMEDLRLIPSCVGGDPKKRTGIVVAKSIPAKKYGITTGEPMAMALRKCPNLVSVPPDFSLYDRCSKAFKAICKEYTFAMESYSIDEVFLDMTGMGKIYPDIEAVAYEIKDRIREELGFTVNVGIGRCKVCAKMASDFEKPDKVHTLYPEEIEKKMWPLPVGELFTCGKASAEKLTKNGIKTIGDLAHASEESLVLLLGEKQGRHLLRYANGIDFDPVVEQREDAKGYSTETTVEKNLETMEDIKKLLLDQADIVCARLRADNAKCYCVGVTMRTTEFKNRSHQRKLKESTNVTSEIYQMACVLMEECWQQEPLRLIGLSVTDIDKGEYEQLSLIVDLDKEKQKEKQKSLDAALDSIRGKYGNGSVKRASTMRDSSRVGKKAKAQMDNK